VELKGKVALVTGSTSGIGCAAAQLLASEGAAVIVSGRDGARGAAIVHEITNAAGSARFAAANLADPSSLRRLIDEVGDVDILVNNAGHFPAGPTATQTIEAFNEIFAVNVRAPYFLTAALAPAMVKKGTGSIINITSMASLVGLPDLSLYSGSKAALDGLTRSWAAEFGSCGVRVNSIAPGPVRTEGVLSSFGEESIKGIAELTMLKRGAAPSEIAEAILFLASDRSSYVTGVSIAIDGGRSNF
jgi:NAD(P)-dependent dehydrogenase (short-subunit alcohol dehydrogenase family)